MTDYCLWSFQQLLRTPYSEERSMFVIFYNLDTNSKGTGWSACTSDKGVSSAHCLSETMVKLRVAAAVGRKTILKPRLAAATNT